MGYLITSGLYIPDLNALNVFSLILGTILLLGSFAAFLGEETTPYSKFGNRGSDNIPSRKAMIGIYLPSVIVCLLLQMPALPWKSQHDLFHFFTLAHFTKRVLEVLFVHIYRSKTDVETVLTIGTIYASTTLFDLLVMRNIPESVFSKHVTNLGIVCFVVGEIINAYHHWLLRKMRLSRNDSNQYHLPVGGLFDYALAPHYAAELLSFVGFILVSQNIVSLALKSFPFIYLGNRAYKTRSWYKTHLTDKNELVSLRARKNLIPFVW